MSGELRATLPRVQDAEIIETLSDCLGKRSSTTPPGWVTVSRECVLRGGADTELIDDWVKAQGGRIRRVQPPASQGLRAGRVVARPPGPVTLVYEIPRAVLSR
jgi:hypothetical protein